MRESLTGGDFKRILREGRKISGTVGSAIVLNSRSGKSRLGAIVSGKIGNAVKRNRIRRIFQEAFRAARINLVQKLDIVIIPRQKAVECTYWEAKEFLDKVISRINEKHINSNNQVL